MVSDSLGKALFHRGELVLDGQYWGRYAEADDYDYVNDKTIRGVCEEMEILSGQKHCPVKSTV